MAGCREEEAPSTYHVEYLNKEKNRIIQVDYEPQATDTEACVHQGPVPHMEGHAL